MQFEGCDVREGSDACLGSAVVGLARVAVDTRHRCGVDDPAAHRLAGLGLLAPVRSSPATRGEGSLEMHIDHGIPLLLGHVREHAVAQDSCVVDDDMQVPEGLDRGVDEALGTLPVRHTLAVRDRLAAHALDLVDHLLGRGQIPARTVHIPAEIVHDDLCAVSSEAQGMFTPDAATGTGDDCNPTFTQTSHDTSPPGPRDPPLRTTGSGRRALQRDYSRRFPGVPGKPAGRRPGVSGRAIA
ncbi:unannotated protein [freshwater metagenome]|uniref:Unannotated protein n=1 Tax=freshwater metagenome TaxID=449393 RepID=A0A6J7URU6_9ZZZZ